MLQKMEADGLKGIAKGVTPPMRIPPELERRGLNMQPGALNVVSSMQEHAVAPLITVQTNIQQLQMKIDRVMEDIRDGLYNSLFLALPHSGQSPDDGSGSCGTARGEAPDARSGSGADSL